VARVVYANSRLRVHRDEVVRPDGQIGSYDWVDVPDQVRVAAFLGTDLVLIDQHHYLVGRTLQLPGGNVEQHEDAHTAAQRELWQETGCHGGSWASHGELVPLPGLSPSKVHLWSASDLTPGNAEPEPSEADLRVVRVSLADAHVAVLDGRVGCAASAALILALPRALA